MDLPSILFKSKSHAERLSRWTLSSILMTGLLYLSCSTEPDTDTVDVSKIQGELIEEPTSPQASPKPVTTVAVNVPASTDEPPLDELPSDELPSDEPPVAQTVEPQARWTEVAKGESTKPPELIEGHRIIGFTELASFPYELPDYEEMESQDDSTAPAPVSHIPQNVLNLHEQAIALKGFMFPLKINKGRVTELLLLRDQSMCCYGATPKINEWVTVKMQDQGIKPLLDEAVTITGKFHVGEIYENGYIVGIYAMEGIGMIGPED